MHSRLKTGDMVPQKKRKERGAYGAEIQHAAVEKWRSGVSVAEVASNPGFTETRFRTGLRAARESGTESVPPADLAAQRKSKNCRGRSLRSKASWDGKPCYALVGR